MRHLMSDNIKETLASLGLRKANILAVKATFDGSRIVLPSGLANVAPGDVIVIFENEPDRNAERADWLRAEEPAFLGVWDNDEESVYDSL